VVGVRVRTSEGERNLDADLVVGCDGRASIVRKQAALEVRRDLLPMDVVWFKIPPPVSWQGEALARFCMGDGHLFICYVAYDAMLQNAWVIPKGRFGELRERTPGEWAAQMARYVPDDLAAHLIECKQDLVHPFLLSTTADRVLNWSVPGALVLGDAAHTMSPVGGQGINIALRDAVVAANQLVPVLRAGGRPEEIDAACGRIEQQRSPEVIRIQALQAIPPKIMLPHTWRAAAARQLPNLLRLGPVRSLAARLAQPFLSGTTRVSLEV